MADHADIASNNIDQETQRAIDNIKPFDEGIHSDCEDCGSIGRIVEGLCVSCRDRYETIEKLRYGKA